MSFLISMQGKTAALEGLFSEPVWLKLYQNDGDPGDFTEATFVGYSPALLEPHEWNFDNGMARHPDRKFECTGGDTIRHIYGYFLERAADGLFIGAERFFDGPYPMLNNGDNVKVRLNFSMKQNG